MTERLSMISVVIPVYNSEGSLGPLVERLEPVLRRVADRYELILVNDASRDDSWRVVGELCARHPWIRGIDLMRNFGQHNALLCGILRARGEVVVTMDDDLQHPPEEIPRLLKALREKDVDVVYGAPRRETHGLLRDLASVVTKMALQNAMGADTARHVSAFRAFRTEIRQAFQHYSGSYISIDVLLTWGTTRFSVVRVRHEQRTIGQSNYTFTKLARHAINMITGFTTWPLRLASFTGFFFTLFGIGVLVYVVGRYLLFGTTVAGFPFLASTIAIFAGAQLFALGIIGEYLARIHLRTMERPAYIVRRDLGADQQEPGNG